MRYDVLIEWDTGDRMEVIFDDDCGNDDDDVFFYGTPVLGYEEGDEWWVVDIH